jgi:hypothetical protein
MMSQENHVNVNDLHAQGWTINEIASKTGFHPATISKYVKHGPPLVTRSAEPPVMTEPWRTRIEVMLDRWPRLLAVSVFNKLRASGFEGEDPLKRVNASSAGATGYGGATYVARASGDTGFGTVGTRFPGWNVHGPDPYNSATLPASTPPAVPVTTSTTERPVWNRSWL